MHSLDALVSSIENLQVRDSFIDSHKLYHYCIQNGLDVPAIYREKRKQDWIRNQLYLSEVKFFADQLCDRMTLLKGASLFFQQVFEPSQRFMGDVDILVCEKHLPEMIKALEQRGYEQLEEKEKWHANDFKILYKKSVASIELVFEIHTRLFYFEPPNFNWSKMKVTNQIYCLDLESTLVHLIGHIGAQHTLLSLHWIYDIHKFTVKYRSQLDLSQVQAKAKVLGLLRSLQFVAYVLKRYFSNSELDLFLQQGIRQHLLPFLINDHFFLKKTYWRWQYYAIKHLIQSNLFLALKYDFFWLLNKRHEKSIKH